jgi:hypothetical protein
MSESGTMTAMRLRERDDDQPLGVAYKAGMIII